MQHPRLSSIRSLTVWLWKQWQLFRLQSILNTISGVLLVGLELAFVFYTKQAVDIATGATSHTTLNTTIIILICITLSQLIIGVISRWMRAVLGVKARNLMQRTLFEKLLATEWNSLKAFHTGNLTNRIERDVNDVVTFLTEHIPTLLTTCTRFIGAFLLLFSMDRMLACIIVCILPFFLLCSKLYIKKMRRITHEVRDTESKLQSIIQESLQHTLIIKTLERIENITQKLFKGQQQLQSQVVYKTRYSTLSAGILNLGFATGYLTTFIWGVNSLQQGFITYGALIAFIQLVGQIQGPVRTLSQFIPVFISTFTAAERIIEMEQLPNEKEAANKEHITHHEARLDELQGIHIDNISFAYRTDERKIFQHLTYDFPPGSITAILGETGAGKTSLIRLLLALSQPNQGNIQLYDKQGHRCAISSNTRSHFSYVPQGNTLLSGTIRENLLLGNPLATDDMLIDALKTACADFVLHLPDGLDTRCGEMGNGLSEGQSQRICIARAILKKSPILLLDEATSALDAETERNVLHNIIRQQQQQTLIFVTHRPEVLKYCTQHLTLRKQKTHAIS